MSTLRSLRAFTLPALTAVATLTTATSAYAQRCLGLPMSGKNYIGAEQREAWTGNRRQTPVYGGRYAHSFDAGKGVGVIASIGGGGGGMKGDTSAVHVSGMLSTSMQPAGTALSLCAGAGFEAHQDQQAGWSTYAPIFITALVGIDRATTENGCLEMSDAPRVAGSRVAALDGI